MGLDGEAFLLNLSLLAATFAAVSTLVMLLRQSMGGALSAFDIHLITTYVGIGFLIAIIAVLPPVIAAWTASPGDAWSIAGVLGAVTYAVHTVALITRRRRVTAVTPLMTYFDWVCQLVVIVMLAANAVLPAYRGFGLYGGALLFALAVVAWSFARRIMSLLAGKTPRDDWDPSKG